jgi:predicted nucleotidyltransferase
MNKKMNGVDKEFLEEIRNRLIEVYHPQLIYLYGSYAWGNPDDNSDLDLFIVVKESDLSMADRIRKGSRILKNIKTPMDLIVFTKKEFDSKKEHPSTLTNKVIKKGIKLYEAA